MKSLPGVILLLAVALTASAQSKDTVRVPDIPAAGKSRVVAVALSMLMPGAGQMYNGEKGKAALHFGLFAGSVTWVALRDIGPTNADIKPLDWLSVVAVGATYVWAAIDAAMGAESGEGPPSGSVFRDVTCPDAPHLSLGTFRSRGISGVSFTYTF